MENDITILDRTKDQVIDSEYITVKMSYDYALNFLLPLINRLDFQRNTLNKKYYERLKKDLIDGCILPPVTIAFDSVEIKNHILSSSNNDELSDYLHSNINKGFILDGIQRLNTLSEAANDADFDRTKTLYGNIIISDSINKLLYRMIILNNGQKPMSARHQIEILMERTIEQVLENKDYQDIVYSEKTSTRGDGKTKLKSEILVKAYLSYSTKSITIDNQKIIESKLNEIISEKIVNSDVKNSNVEFKKIFAFLVELVNYSNGDSGMNLIDWFNNENNTIGFFVGVANRNDVITTDLPIVTRAIEIIEEIIANINPSKVKMSSTRRKVVSDVIKDYDKFDDEDYRDDYILGL